MDASQLKPSDYRLVFEGSPLAPVLTRMSDGKVFNASSTPPLNSGNLAAGFDADGLRFTVPAATIGGSGQWQQHVVQAFEHGGQRDRGPGAQPGRGGRSQCADGQHQQENTGTLQLSFVGANDLESRYSGRRKHPLHLNLRRCTYRTSHDG